MAGLTAQNLEEVFPDWVEDVKPSSADSDLIPEGEKVKAIHFPHDFNAYLIEAIKVLDAENEALREQNDAQDVLIKALMERVNRLEGLER